MRNAKRITAAALTAAMAMGLMGTTAFADGTKITLFQSKTEIMDPLTQMADDYADETGNEIEVWETTGDNYLSDLKTDLSTNKGPVLFSLQPGAESLQMKDYREDLGDLDFVGDIKANLADQIDGKTVGIPYTVEGFGLVYNKDLVDPSTITTTDDLIKFLDSQKGTDVNGLGLSQEDYFLIAHIFNYPFAVQEDPDGYLQKVLSGQERLVDNDAFQEWVKLMDAIRTDCTNPVDITYDQNCGDFATGKTAMIHQGNWAWSMFADYDLDTEKVGMAPVPVLGNTKLSVSVPICWYVNTDATDDEKQAAKDFLNWLYTSDTGKDYLMNQFGFIPVVEGMESDSLDPLSQSVADAVASENIIPWVMSDWPAGIVTTDLSPIAKDFFTSDMSTDDFLNQLNDAFVNAAESSTEAGTEAE